MTLEERIDIDIHNSNISDEVIQQLCEDSEYQHAYNWMLEFDSGSFHDLLANEETFSSIFHHFIKSVKPFRMTYKYELEQLMEQEYRDNE